MTNTRTFSFKRIITLFIILVVGTMVGHTLHGIIYSHAPYGLFNTICYGFTWGTITTAIAAFLHPNYYLYGGER